MGAAEPRALRGIAGPGDVRDREEAKASRSAPVIADTVVDDNGSRLVLERRLDRIALDAVWSTATPFRRNDRDR
ncbi:hypothetical protein [Streptomyces palmae]|uniref:Uncharacterized protein n=1 Tax=Streptomyces palmae TaxID=1701085 RepID=A0A4Z0GLC0_9ACTN|nr:hypothetical protein [Streptomyces palmae]TGA97187.1 hypothetical protein E4099_23685 [Streptomyces palmae]